MEPRLKENAWISNLSIYSKQNFMKIFAILCRLNVNTLAVVSVGPSMLASVSRPLGSVHTTREWAVSKITPVSVFTVRDHG